jgi:hypothetical protein
VERLFSKQLDDAQQATLAAQQQALDLQRAGGDACAAADKERLSDSVSQTPSSKRRSVKR